MRYFKKLMVFLFLSGIPTISESQVTLTISPTGHSYERTYKLSFNRERRIFSDSDSIWVQLPTNCEGRIDIIINEMLMDSLVGETEEEGKAIIRMSNTTAKIKTGYTFCINVKKELETRRFTQIFKYSIIPGGGRFYAKKPWQGIGIAILQIAPVPFAIYCNEERKKYYSLAQEAAARGDREELDKNFKKSQDFRQWVGFATGVAITATLVNIFDVVINVKDIRCVPMVSNDGFRLGIIKNW